MPLAPIPEILDDLRAGRVIVLVDDENRENEGDFVVAAESLDVETLNFITRVGNGYLCVAMDGASCDRLELAPAVATNTSLRGTAFTVSVDGHPRHGVGTGISARDRVKTIRMLADPDSRPDDFVRPGHVNPLRARDGGTLVRTGQTEGSVDLCRLAGLLPAAVIIEIVRPDGEMARMPDLERLCVEHGIRMCSVEQVIEHRLQREALVKRLNPVEGTTIDTPEGRFDLFAWSSAIDPTPHLALTVGGVGRPDAQGRWQILGDAAHKRVNPVLYRVEELLETWKRITAPVLWVDGDRTDVEKWWAGRYPREEFEQRIAVVGRLQRHRLSPCGHMLHHDQPAALAERLLAFLDEPA